MIRDPTRRGLIGAIALGATAGGFLGPVRTYLDRFAPPAGDAWQAARRSPPDQVDSPYGPATIRYDEAHVPRIEASTEAALYFAVGYAQGLDRLFQLDLQRRQIRGLLSEVVGEATLASDRFHTRMDFLGAARATVDTLRGSETFPLVEAYCEGVNRSRSDLALPLEFQLLEYEPDPWRPVDVALTEKQIAWGLTGSFRTLHRETLAAKVGEEAASTLMPNRLDHQATILDHEGATEEWAPSGSSVRSGHRNQITAGRETRGTSPSLESWLSAFESSPWVGSNSWAIAGEHTANGQPVVANDPHLPLQAPPIWYEQALKVPGYRVRGVAFPGTPFVVIGETDTGAWGFTTAGADVIDFYDYDTRNDGTEYRYGDEWREFETASRNIPVADGEDREVTIRKSVHGPVVERGPGDDELRSAVGVAWTGLTGTRTMIAVHDMARSDGIDEFEGALESFDITQNCVYADRDGNVLYRATGKVPIRRTGGEPVRGDRVFDGSAREGEWPGYTPYGRSSWEGFIPFAEMPHVRNPEYVGTANQRIVDDAVYPYYFAEAYSEPFRGIQLWDRLDTLVSRGSVTTAEMRELQRDVRDRRAEPFIRLLVAERDALDEGLEPQVDRLRSWDQRMTRDSRSALVFDRFLAHYREVSVRRTIADALDDRRDPTAYEPSDWVLARLEPDSRWFPEGRGTAVNEALQRALAEIETEGWETYGDFNRTTIDHPFDRSWLNYPRYPLGGSEATLFNVHPEADRGSSWRQVCPLGTESQCVLPGGNDGSPFGAHYDDQLRRWADGEYKRMDRAIRGTVAVRFVGEDG